MFISVLGEGEVREEEEIGERETRGRVDRLVLRRRGWPLVPPEPGKMTSVVGREEDDGGKRGKSPSRAMLGPSTCESCLLGKMTKSPFTRKGE